MTNDSSLLYEVNNSVATITLNRPHVKNALNVELHHALFDALDKASKDSNVSVIILQGAGDAFCAGADLKSIGLDDVGAFDYGHYLRETYNRLILQLVSIEKPIVAHLNGIAVGAGLSIALACDYRVASYDAKLGLGFLKIGLVPDAGASYFLPRLVGLGKAMELALGELISAEEAYRINLITKIGQPEELVEQLKHVPQKAFGLTKKTFRESFERNLAEVLEIEVSSQRQAGNTPEHRAAIERFVKKRSYE